MKDGNTVVFTSNGPRVKYPKYTPTANISKDYSENIGAATRFPVLAIFQSMLWTVSSFSFALAFMLSRSSEPTMNNIATTDGGMFSTSTYIVAFMVFLTFLGVLLHFFFKYRGNRQSVWTMLLSVYVSAFLLVFAVSLLHSVNISPTTPQASTGQSYLPVNLAIMVFFGIMIFVICNIIVCQPINGNL